MQAKPGAAEAARDGGVGLREFFEDVVKLVGRDADAGVAHAPFYFHAAFAQRLAGNIDSDETVGRVFDGVAEQVRHHAPKAHGVAHDIGHAFALEIAGKAEAFLRAERGDRLDDVGDDLRQGEGDGFELDAPGLDLREV